MKKLVLILGLVFAVNLVAQVPAKAGVLIGFPLPLPIPLPVFYGPGPGWYGPGYYNAGYYWGPRGYGYYGHPYWRGRYWAGGRWHWRARNGGVTGRCGRVATLDHSRMHPHL